MAVIVVVVVEVVIVIIGIESEGVMKVREYL